MKTLKDYLAETIRRYGAVGSSPGMGYTVEDAAVKYGVFAKGGSVGSQRFRDDPLKTFDSKEEAIADARRRRSGLSKGERGYYRMSYIVKPIKGVTEGSIEERSVSQAQQRTMGAAASALEENAELRLILQRAKLIE